MKDSLHKLLRKNVEVVVAGGITYKGQFIEASEETLYLKAETGWITVPMERVKTVRAQDSEEDEGEEWRDRDVDPSFFRFK